MNCTSTPSVADAAYAALADTLADMAFVDVMRAENDGTELDVRQIMHIRLLAPCEGEMALYLPLAAKQLIVGNTYGSEWETLDATQIDDCLLETLNVLAGNFLKECFGEDTQHEVSLPELLFDESELKDTQGLERLFYDAEGIPIGIAVRLRERTEGDG